MLLEDFRRWLRKRRQSGPVRMHGCREARRRQRLRQEITVMDGEANLAAVAGVEARMRAQEGLRLGRRRVGKSVDIVMAVALSVTDADQRAEREVLLHGEPGLTGQVLAGDEIFSALRAPLGGAGGVDDRFVDALARLRRDTAIAERAGHGKGVIAIIG